MDQPENQAVGLPRYYATSVTFDGFAQPVISYHLFRAADQARRAIPIIPSRKAVAISSCRRPSSASMILIARKLPTRRGEPATWKDVAAAISTLRRNWESDQGQGLRLLMGLTSSPTLLRQLDALGKQFPKMKIHAHDAAGEAARRNLTSAAYGQPLDLYYVLDDCDVVVSFDDDFLGPGPNQVRNARGWAASRRRSSGQPGIRLYGAVSVPTASGAVAGDRLIADASRMARLAEALANKLGVGGAAASELTPAEKDWIQRAAEACETAKQRALVTSGPFGDEGTAVWVARVNDTLKRRLATP